MSTSHWLLHAIDRKPSGNSSITYRLTSDIPWLFVPRSLFVYFRQHEKRCVQETKQTAHLSSSGCSCDSGGSYGTTCNDLTGACLCLRGVGGSQCDRSVIVTGDMWAIVSISIIFQNRVSVADILSPEGERNMTRVKLCSGHNNSHNFTGFEIIIWHIAVLWMLGVNVGLVYL